MTNVLKGSISDKKTDQLMKIYGLQWVFNMIFFLISSRHSQVSSGLHFFVSFRGGSILSHSRSNWQVDSVKCWANLEIIYRSIDGGSAESLNFHNYPEFDDGDFYKSRWERISYFFICTTFVLNCARFGRDGKLVNSRLRLRLSLIDCWTSCPFI